MLRASLVFLLVIGGSAAMADGKIPSGGFTSLQAPQATTQRITVSPGLSVPGMLSVSCCCGTQQVSFISGVVVNPSVTVITTHWGANG